MATARATIIPMDPQMHARRREQIQASVQKLGELVPTKIPTLMLAVAVFLDGIQFIAGLLFLGLAALPVVGILFTIVYYLISALITIFFLLLFRFWLHSVGYKGNLLLMIGLVVITEIFLSGVIPSWTAFVLRVRYIAHKGNKAKEKLRKLEEAKIGRMHSFPSRAALAA